MKKIWVVMLIVGALFFTVNTLFAADEIDEINALLEELGEEGLEAELDDMEEIPALTKENYHQIRNQIINFDDRFDPNNPQHTDPIYTALIQWGINRNLYENDKDFTYMSPFMYFIMYGYEKLVTIANEFEPNIHIRDHDVRNGYNNLLLCCCGNGMGEKYVPFLLDKCGYKTVINYTNRNGHAPLHVACITVENPAEGIVKKVNPNLIKLLIDCGANVNIRDNEGRTPIMYAIFSACSGIASGNAYEAIKILTKNGADILNIKDINNQSALSYAMNNKQCPPQVLMYLMSVVNIRGY